jgi:uncharacterized protein YcbX
MLLNFFFTLLPRSGHIVMLAITNRQIKEIVTFDIDYEPDAEEVVITINNHLVVRASKGTQAEEVVYDRNFRDLEDDDDALFDVLSCLVAKLFAMEA